MLQRFSLTALVLAIAVLPAWSEEIKTLAGKTVKGSLEKITATEITLKTETGPVATPLSQVLDVNLHPGKKLPTAEKYTEVLLIDESVLRCGKIAFGAKEVQLDLTTGASVKVPLAAIASIMRDAQDDNLRKQWNKLMKTKKRGDRIFVLRSGDLNPIDGLLKEVDAKDQSIKFKPDEANEVELKLDRLQGMVFFRSETPPDTAICKVIDLDGNILVATKLASEGPQVTVATSFGTSVTIDAKAVARLDFNFGRLTYLSDLAAKITNSPLLGGFSALRKDANLDGNPIMLLDKQYAKGLSMYAGAEVEYNLGGKYKNFKAMLGADARIAEEGQGKVTVTIYCDQEKRFSEVVSTKEARTISLNVKDVNHLRIVVTGANFTNYSGHATLANALVSQ